MYTDETGAAVTVVRTFCDECCKTDTYEWWEDNEDDEEEEDDE